MISFKKIRYKNFLSTGNIPIEVELDKSHTTLIVGSNGSGKHGAAALMKLRPLLMAAACTGVRALVLAVSVMRAAGHV